MSRVRDLLSHINDVEATIARVESEADVDSTLAYELSLKSLEERRDMLREELAEATREGFIEVCDYRLIPASDDSYPLTAITSALREFQELVTIVYDAITTKPKKRATHDLSIIEKTQFDFGFAYTGSLGIALMIENERLLGIDSYLDQAVDAVFRILEISSKEALHDTATNYGVASVRKLYHLSKVHRDYGMSAEIKWIRERETRNSVLAEPKEFSHLCALIEARGEEHTEPVSLRGTLAKWDTVGRGFILIFPDADPIRGTVTKEFDISLPRTVQGEYEAQLRKHTKFNYLKDEEEVSWELIGLSKLN